MSGTINIWPPDGTTSQVAAILPFRAPIVVGTVIKGESVAYAGDSLDFLVKNNQWVEAGQVIAVVKSPNVRLFAYGRTVGGNVGIEFDVPTNGHLPFAPASLTVLREAFPYAGTK
ncbi:MAG: hypothetical protein M1153_01505 [Patescibacteria group bacterium]|nr:hypothetical protein [Patescibacteria group bacterium]